jgi:hypothetical protein
MIKILSSGGVAINSDRQKKDWERFLANGRNFSLFMNDKHHSRLSEYHLRLLGIATGGTSNWDELAKIYAKKMTPIADEFLRTTPPHDNIDDKPYGIAYMVGCGCEISFDASEYQLPVFNYGVVGKLRVAIAHRTANDTVSVQTLNQRRVAKNLDPIPIRPLMMVMDTGIVDVNSHANPEIDLDFQLRYKENPNYTTGGSLWVRQIVQTMNDREFWEFLQTARQAQMNDKRPPPGNEYKSANWLVGFQGAILDKSYDEANHETRKDVFAALARAVRII